MNASCLESEKHILVVADDEHLELGLRYNFEADGYRVSSAKDGYLAVGVMKDAESEIDLVLLDLDSPLPLGLALAKELRSSDPDIPLLMLSSRLSDEECERGYEIGPCQLLIKPFDLDELLQNVSVRIGKD